MLYLQRDKWTLPLLLWERRQIGTTCVVALLPGLLTCTSHSRPHSDATPRARGHFYARWCRERLAEWQFIGKLWFESAVSVWCMDVRYREHEFKSQAERVACKWTTSSRVKVTQNRASYKMLQKAGRREGWGEKMTKSSVCVLTAFQVIYTEWKKEKNCVDFMSLLGENY